MWPEVNVLIVTFLLMRRATCGFEARGGGTNEIESKLWLGYPIDSLLNFTELTTKYGYPSEEHTVVTEDGYILSIFRIFKGKNCRGIVRRPPVLLMHGLLMSSDAWLDSGPGSGLAYLLSDACYDLWAGNVRGNAYGKRHRKLDVAGRDFWDFSVDEIGLYDLPAMIDYILHYTASDKLNYIGHSQGSGVFFIMCSGKGSYSEKVKVLINLAPISRNTHCKSKLGRLVTKFYLITERLLTGFGIFEALPKGGTFQSTTSYLCKDYIIANTLCRAILYLMDSRHPGSVETETIRVLMGHFTSGTSVKNLIWFGQSLNLNEFQNFDYGDIANMNKYNTAKPPEYNLSAVTTPTVVISGLNDFLTAPADIEWLISRLPNVLEHYVVKDPLWNHLDVTYSKLTSLNILPKILQYLGMNSDV